MKLHISNLWRWDGAIGRSEYFCWGVLLFAVKYNLDRLLSSAFTGRSWTPFDPEQARLYLWQSLSARADGPYYLALLAVSLPFLWAGVVLTMRRLRAVGWRPWWVALFFVPVLKLVFFALLCVMP